MSFVVKTHTEDSLLEILLTAVRPMNAASVRSAYHLRMIIKNSAVISARCFLIHGISILLTKLWRNVRMAKILIPDIAKLLGVELDEEFQIRSSGCKKCEPGIYKFDLGEGLVKKDENGVFNSNSSVEFEDLCLGNYEVVKLPWEPKEGDTYYCVNIFKKRIEAYQWIGFTGEYVLKLFGMVYRTKEEAKAHLAEDYEKLTGKPLSSC